MSWSVVFGSFIFCSFWSYLPITKICMIPKNICDMTSLMFFKNENILSSWFSTQSLSAAFLVTWTMHWHFYRSICSFYSLHVHVFYLYRAFHKEKAYVTVCLVSNNVVLAKAFLVFAVRIVLLWFMSSSISGASWRIEAKIQIKLFVYGWWLCLEFICQYAKLKS